MENVEAILYFAAKGTMQTRVSHSRRLHKGHEDWDFSVKRCRARNMAYANMQELSFSFY